MPPPQSQAILFEMLRSFTTLAQTLNLSKAVRVLGSTRQTLRRHIDILEEYRGEKLFEVQDRQYSLTEAGSRSLEEAITLLARGEAWLSGSTTSVDGLAQVRFDDNQGNSTCSQQHPVTRIWQDGPPLLQVGLQAWAESNARLGHTSMERLTPYLNVFRKHENSWLCVHVGEESSIARWLGPVWAKSAIGCVFADDPVSSGADVLTIEIYDKVANEGSLRLDHLFVRMPRVAGGEPLPARYQRFLFGCYFPDGSPAVANLIAITDQVDIPGQDLSNVPRTPSDVLMEFDL
jgi:hypothetical protein